MRVARGSLRGSFQRRRRAPDRSGVRCVRETDARRATLDRKGGKTYLNRDVLEGGFVRDGRAKEKNKKRKREPRRRRRRLSTLVDDDDDDDDAISGSRLVVAGVPAPGILLFGFFRRAGERKNVQKWKSTAVLRCPAVFFALFLEMRQAYFGVTS